MAEDDGFLSRWSRRKLRAQPERAVDPAPLEETQRNTAAASATTAEPAPAATAALAEPARSLSEPMAAGAQQAAPTHPAQHSGQPPPPPPPTLEEAMQLTTRDDFSRFVGRGVSPQVKNTALKTLFSDPHFNVMDGLDTYIGDYNTPDPLPAGMLRQMVQSAMLGIFDDEPKQGSNEPTSAESAESSEEQTTPEPPEPPDTSPLAAPAAAPTTVTLETPPSHEDPAVRLQPNDDAGPAGDQPGPVQDPRRAD